jgi:tetratricopeptide (TPR) repeat protein
MGFAVIEQWEHTYKLAHQITEAGLWASWSQLLSNLLAHEYDDSSMVAWLDLMRGVALRWLGQLSDASRHLERAQAYYTSEGNPHQADVMIELAVIRRYQGEWEKAQLLLLAALDLCTSFGILHGVERSLHELGQLALEDQEPDRALDWIGRLEPWSIRTWGIAAQAYLLLGHLDQARQAASSPHVDAHSSSHAWRAAATLGLIYDRLGELDAAVAYSLLATEWLERAKDMVGYARACNNLAVATDSPSQIARCHLRTCIVCS